jgi:hypothetical protein
MGERLFVNRAQAFDRSIGIGRGLEVCDEVIAIVTPAQLPNSLVDLLDNRLAGQAATGAETAVVAEVATSISHRPVYVWTRKTGINTDFLNSMSKDALKMKVVTIIAKSSRAPVIALLKCLPNLFR